MSSKKVHLNPFCFRRLWDRRRGHWFFFSFWSRNLFIRRFSHLGIWPVFLRDLGKIIGEMKRPFLIHPFIHLSITRGGEEDQNNNHWNEHSHFLTHRS